MDNDDDVVIAEAYRAARGARMNKEQWSMNAIKSPIYQTEQIRTFEQLAIERFDISGFTLMQRAGKAALDFLLRRFPNAQKIAIYCGSGNNGGDGYVLARMAHDRGLKIKIWQVGHHDQLKNEAKRAHDLCREADLSMTPFSEHTNITVNSNNNNNNNNGNLHHNKSVDLIVDAICGIGIHDELKGDARLAVETISRSSSSVPILAIDVPTGIDADTGKVCGQALRATATITFIGLKFGLLTGQGCEYAGELALNDLQLPPELFAAAKPVAEKIHFSQLRKLLQPRPRDWHKGLSGHVLIVGGELGYSGAPRMAALAALRVGAGLVTVATRAENALLMNIANPEIMCQGITNVDMLNNLIAKADVIVLGPGLGQSGWSKSIFEKVLSANLPMVIDADGLNLLAQSKKFKQNWILTPHPGEAARLIETTVPNVQQDRLSALHKIEHQYGGVTVLKGAGSLVGEETTLPALCDKGNPGMASAGMGDVLSGVIGGLLAQRIQLFDAAKLGVYLHAKAGDLAAREGERGMIATDLMPYLRRLANQMTT